MAGWRRGREDGKARSEGKCVEQDKNNGSFGGWCGSSEDDVCDEIAEEWTGVGTGSIGMERNMEHGARSWSMRGAAHGAAAAAAGIMSPLRRAPHSAEDR